MTSPDSLCLTPGTPPSETVLVVVDRQPGWDRWVVSARVRDGWTLVGVFHGWADACDAMRAARVRFGPRPRPLAAAG